jgi:uncharacterized protein DUF2798
MDGKAKFIFPILATGSIAFVVSCVVTSCVVTFSNSGLRAAIVTRWLSAFFVGWPVASVMGLIAFPCLRRATVGVAALLERA